MSSNQKLRSLLIVVAGGYSTFVGINVYRHNEAFYKNYLMPVVHLLDPETAHRFAVVSSKYRILPKSKFVDTEALKINILGREFSNPVGIAAGFDKHGEAVKGLNDIGFGFVEIGSVTPKPQQGNPKPRVFRLKEDNAVINRYGFNSEGHDIVYDRISNLRRSDQYEGIVGVNLGKNKESEDPIEDYVMGIKKFASVADYFVINVSSPNTPGLRRMQDKTVLKDLLRVVVTTKNQLDGFKPPILLKLAPDLTYDQRKDVADVVNLKECRVDGLIISNTTVERPQSLQNEYRSETGGLSGNPVKDVSTQMISDMYRLTKGITIIGVGGISNGQDAYEKIKAGASAVQIYTSLIYDGPPVVAKIKKELLELLQQDSYKNISEAVGTNVN